MVTKEEKCWKCTLGSLTSWQCVGPSEEELRTECCCNTQESTIVKVWARLLKLGFSVKQCCSPFIKVEKKIIGTLMITAHPSPWGGMGTLFCGTDSNSEASLHLLWVLRVTQFSSNNLEVIRTWRKLGEVTSQLQLSFRGLIESSSTQFREHKFIGNGSTYTIYHFI